MNRLLSVLLLAAACLAQQSASPRLSTAASATPDSLVIPAGTKVLLSLIHPISTKSARVGDGVYLKTSFPVTIEDQMAIPAGTYVQGEITEVKRPGKVKGRAELRFRFNTLIFPSGYTLSLPAAVEDVPAMENAKMKDSEGTIQANGTKGRDAATIGSTTATGALIGLSAGGKGSAIGAGVGGVTGLAIAMLTRGNDVRLEPGTAVEMVFQRRLLLNRNKLRGNAAANSAAPDSTEERPKLTPPPQTN